MKIAEKRRFIRAKKKRKVRSKISGTGEIPRLSVFRSLSHMYAQVVDDEQGKTLFSSSTLDATVKEKLQGKSGNKNAAKVVGENLAKKLLDKGISKIVFDRNGYLYHGRVQSLAEGLRESGLQF